MSFALFAVLTALVSTGRADQVDRSAMLALAAHRTAALTWCMRVITTVGSGAIEIPAALTVYAGLRARGRLAAAHTYLAGCLTGWALYAVVKVAVHRTRPRIVSRLAAGAGWYSYPSGHTMLAPLVFGLAVIAWTAAARTASDRLLPTAVVAALACGIGLSRVYLGLHFPTDVLAGLALGTGWATLWAPRVDALVLAPRPVDAGA